MYYVYGLVDPTSNMICYVGITGNTPHKRFVQHLSRLERDVYTPKGEWLNALIDNGYFPHVVTLQIVDTEQQAQIAERWWIAHGQMIGWPLRNTSHFVRPIESREPNESGEPYPLGLTRELTAAEVAQVQRMKAEGLSGNAICERIFGPKNTQRLDIIRRAVEGGAA